MASVVLQNVAKNYDGLVILEQIDLDIKDGDFVVFVGPSGCGKSTLLRMIAGLTDISEGDIFIGREKVNNVPPAERRIAMVFQSYALYPHMTVFENMSFSLRMAKEERKIIEEKVRKAAQILQLEQLLDRKPKNLSGGQRQRVAIGRAIVRQPEVFLFDEPLSNLDAELRVDMRVQLTRLHNQLTATMIYVTHDQVEAMTMADRIVVLNDGNLQQVGTPMELYHYPRNRFVAGFIGSPKMNFLKVKAEEGKQDSVTISLNGAKTSLPVEGKRIRSGDELTLGIRPKHINPTKRGDLVLKAKGDVLEKLGGLSYAYLNLISSGENLTVEIDENASLDINKEINLGVDARDCHLFNRDGQACRRLTKFTV